MQKWRIAWSSAVGRWYYNDRKTGETAWEKPLDCTIDVKTMEPPSDKIPEEPVVTVPGWEPVWDREAQAYYYYNVVNGVWGNPDGRVKISGTKLTWLSGEYTEDSTIEFIGKRRIRICYAGIRYDGRVKGDGKLHLLSMSGGFRRVWEQEADTVERQWFNPSKKSDSDAFAHQQYRHNKHTIAFEDEMQYQENKHLVGILWDQKSFKLRLDESAVGNHADPILHKKTMAEVKENNDYYIEKVQLRIPDTHLVTHDMCIKAIIDKDVEAFVGHAPIMTVSNQTVACAAAFFALDLRRSVCVLNSSSGRADDVARNYLEGAPDMKTVHHDMEGELCRRIPNLFDSLARAKTRKFYPIGPCTCRDVNDPQQYHTVLYTSGQEYNADTGGNLPGLRLARYGIEHGYECYSKLTMNRAVGVVTAAAPMTRQENPQAPANSPRDQGTRDDIVDHMLLKRTITNIFTAPVMYEPRLTTIVLGPWGAQDAMTAERMGNMFGEAVMQPRKVALTGATDTMHTGSMTYDAKMSENFDAQQSHWSRQQEGKIKLGQLYHEIHFALPTRNELESSIAEAFRRGLEKAGVRLGKIDQLADGNLY